MKKHLLQSDQWAEYQRSEGKKVFHMEDETFSTTVWVNKTPLGDYLFAGYGPHMEAKQALRPALRALIELAKNEGMAFVRIEPTVVVSRKELEVAIRGTKAEQKRGKARGFKRVKALKTKNIDPEHTWVLDLEVPEEELLREMESNKVRSWRNMAKRGMAIRVSEDPAEITILSKLLAGVGERDHFTPQDEAHLRRQMEAGFAKLYIVDLSNGEGGQPVPIAAALVYDYNGTTRYYAHAGTDDEYRKLRAGAVLMVQMILDAKNAGMSEFDFWGITTSEDPSHPWYGFTQFKKAFGGEQVNYGGTWDIVVRPGKYWIYNLVRKANLWVRKLKK